MTVSDIASGSKCDCFTGIRAEAAIIYLLNQIAGGTLTVDEIAANSRCYCFTGTNFQKAVIYLLSVIADGGGAGGTDLKTAMTKFADVVYVKDSKIDSVDPATWAEPATAI